MQRRSTFVARLPADIDAIELPRRGAAWYRDPLTIPLRLRASRRGHTWIFHGRIRGEPRRQTLGRYPRMNLEQARAVAARIASEGAPASVPLTFSQLRLAYFESAEFKKLADRTQRSYKWVLQGKDYEGLASRKIRDITRLDLLAIKDKIATDGRAFQNILRPAQALFSWALDRGHVDVSPASRLKLPLNEADPQPYTDTDLGSLVEAAEAAEEPWRTLYLLVAHTGQRPATWTDAKWSEIDIRNATLTVSRVRGRKTKRKRGWSIPLAAPAVALLQALHKRQGRGRNEWLFGRRLVVEQKVRDRIAKAAGMAAEGDRGTLHRLRATMLTKFNRWRVPTEVQQRMAGHANPFEGSRAHYIPAPPTQEMHELAARYAEHVQMCRLL
jgi:integrase